MLQFKQAFNQSELGAAIAIAASLMMAVPCCCCFCHWHCCFATAETILAGCWQCHRLASRSSRQACPRLLRPRILAFPCLPREMYSSTQPQASTCPCQFPVTLAVANRWKVGQTLCCDMRFTEIQRGRGKRNSQSKEIDRDQARSPARALQDETSSTDLKEPAIAWKCPASLRQGL